MEGGPRPAADEGPPESKRRRLTTEPHLPLLAEPARLVSEVLAAYARADIDSVTSIVAAVLGRSALPWTAA